MDETLTKAHGPRNELESNHRRGCPGQIAGSEVMTYLALSKFLAVAAKSGKSRITKVRNIKHDKPYSPAIDLYKPLRERIVSLHRAGKSKAALTGILAGIKHAQKLSSYPAAISGYRAWWGARTMKWFEPPGGKYSKHGFEIGVNPELGLEINGVPNVVKLYLSVPPLAAADAALIGALMLHVVGGAVPQATLGILDVRRSAFAPVSPTALSLLSTVDSVLTDMAAIWPTV